MYVIYIKLKFEEKARPAFLVSEYFTHLEVSLFFECLFNPEIAIKPPVFIVFCSGGPFKYSPEKDMAPHAMHLRCPRVETIYTDLSILINF